MEITINLSEEDLAKLEQFRQDFITDAIKHKNAYQEETWKNASIPKLFSYYVTAKLQNW